MQSAARDAGVAIGAARSPMTHAYYGPEFSEAQIGGAIDGRKAKIESQHCSVTRASNPCYDALMDAFYTLSGVPMVLNTSFNENEPVVCRPEEALDCFLRTKMDVLLIGRLVHRAAKARTINPRPIRPGWLEADRRQGGIPLP